MTEPLALRPASHLLPSNDAKEMLKLWAEPFEADVGKISG